ncbi:protein delta homolog 1-like isoform X2 [Crotalus tigris]|uniref:protein delta homolog 1-like isoform X2 n=1 Tax=Crotalus tigris TaxID=88082 RepID=UPI00192F63A0|nr:protein delta homolog 1-like isoform X2 [Crotalus tigris]XP_039198449.1 protein delta homolog 1-like isoform X2 [Crotalus tigris]
MFNSVIDLAKNHMGIQGTDCKPGCHPVNGFCEVSNECRCRHGWQGPLCDQCVPFSGCLHGKCVKPGQCMCEEGWIGSHCDTVVHPCSSKPCSNYSKNCVETGNGRYTCLCAQGYMGKNCHMKKGPCIVNGSPCQNGGSCLDNDGFAPYASCMCSPGFTGQFCERDIDDCEPNPCENGGTCTDIGKSFHCSCPIGYEGVLCSNRIPACDSSPCENGGTCHGHRGRGFMCICKPYFVGATCSFSTRNTSVYVVAKQRRNQNHHLHLRGHRKPAQQQEKEILTIKETIENRQSLLTKSQVICFMILSFLTCLVVLGTTGIIFFSKFEVWLANARYSHLLRKERDFFLKANDDENVSVNIIFPEKINQDNE